jgi:hypothetical protein
MIMRADPAVCLPNLLIIGAMKASTTLLYKVLGGHPAVWFPEEKEPSIFIDGIYEQPGAWERYCGLFAACPEGKLFRGEASIAYTKHPHLGDVPKRIAEKLGQPKLIYMLRDPVERAISNFRHSHARNAYPRGHRFGQALREDPIVVDASRYMMQLRRYWEVFGEGSVHILLAEELHEEQGRAMRGVAEFLGLAPHENWDLASEAVNSAESVKVQAGWERWLGRSKGWKRLAGWLPKGMKNRLKRMAPRVQIAPEVSSAEREECLELLAKDLVDLHGYLGRRIERWRSIREVLIGERADRLRMREGCVAEEV